MNSVAAPPPFLDERKALACVHCGLCLSACPTYLETGNENDSPRGRIHLMRSIQAGRLPLNAATRRHLDLCLGCRACETACPSGVQYGSLLETTRDYVERTTTRGWFDRLLRHGLIERIFPYPERTRIAMAPARVLRATGLHRLFSGRVRALLELMPERDRDSGDAREFELPTHSPAHGASRGTVGLVTGCVMSVLFRNTHRNTIRLLNLAGYDVVVPTDQGCCGALYAHGGNLAAARKAARKNLAAFQQRFDAIVINAAGCGSTLKEYGHLLGEDPERSDAAAHFAARVRDLTELLSASEVFLNRLKDLPPPAGGLRVTCHDACHLAHAQGITDAPRKLIRAAAGELYVELPEADVCCGSAGSYNLTEPAMASRLQARKSRNIAAIGPVTVVTTNPGCLLQIAAGLRAAGYRESRVMHIADWLVERLDEHGAGVVPQERSRQRER